MNRAQLSSPSVQIEVLGYGARLGSVRTVDRSGEFAEIALGFDSEEGWRGDRDYLGATIGRFANRIAGGRFTLDGAEYTIPPNEGAKALHGGQFGFDSAEFSLSEVTTDERGAQSVTARRTSPDGESGFPGELDIAVTFTVLGDVLTISYLVTTTAPTVLNMTNHAYWNLSGRPGTAEGHRIVLAAGHYLPVDADLMPTGEVASVEGTVFDLREPVLLADRLRVRDPQAVLTKGFDHCYVVDRAAADPAAVVFAARLEEPVSGRTLEVHTDQPGIQLYTGNFLDGTKPLRGGSTARQGDAISLEPQQFPDAPNRPEFPSTVLRPGEEYRQVSEYRFGLLG